MAALENEGHNCWLYLIPFYHMSIDAKPVQGASSLTQKWWGTEGFDDLVQKFKALNLR